MSYMNSKRFTLNEADIKKWAWNILIYAGIPAVIFFLGEVAKIVPVDWKYYGFAIFAINAAVDLLKKYIDGKK